MPRAPAGRGRNIGNVVLKSAREPATSQKEIRMLYHITPVENVPSIREMGLRANAAGQIFLFTHKMVADTIAVSQVFCRHYGLFAIYARGVTGHLQPDKVAEAYAPFQRILVGQPVIQPHHLKYLGDRQPPEGKPKPFDYYWWRQVCGWTRREVDRYWAMKATGRSIGIDPTTQRPRFMTQTEDFSFLESSTKAAAGVAIARQAHKAPTCLLQR